MESFEPKPELLAQEIYPASPLRPELLTSAKGAAIIDSFRQWAQRILIASSASLHDAPTNSGSPLAMVMQAIERIASSHENPQAAAGDKQSPPVPQTEINEANGFVTQSKFVAGLKETLHAVLVLAHPDHDMRAFFERIWNTAAQPDRLGVLTSLSGLVGALGEFRDFWLNSRQEECWPAATVCVNKSLGRLVDDLTVLFFEFKEDLLEKGAGAKPTRSIIFAPRSDQLRVRMLDI